MFPLENYSQAHYVRVMQSKPKIRLYVEADLTEGAPLMLGTQQSHYLMHVMRCEEGQSLLVFNGMDGEWEASITQPHKKHTQLLCVRQEREQTHCPDVWLLFSPVKNKNEIIIEKAVELGVSKILPVLTHYCVVRKLNEERMQARIIEAAEQCGRLDLPELVPLQNIERALGDWHKERTLLFADERGSGAPIHALPAEKLAAPKAILIGPEGGFSEHEHEVISKQAFTLSMSLGPRILRADTAAISALACLMACAGDWDTPTCYPALTAGTKL